jgi:hypothetical protein
VKEPMPGTIDLHEVCNTIANDLQDALRLNSFPLVIEAIQHHTGTKVSRSYLIQRTERVQLGYQGPWPTAQKLVALWNTLQACVGSITKNHGSRAGSGRSCVGRMLSWRPG